MGVLFILRNTCDKDETINVEAFAPTLLTRRIYSLLPDML